MTGRDVYVKALSIINERDSQGEWHSDTADYEKNAHELINILVSKLWCDDCIVRGIPIEDWRYTLEDISCLDEELSIHSAFLPALSFALASLLIHDEDRERADYYYKLFRDTQASLVRNFARANHTAIKDVYS